MFGEKLVLLTTKGAKSGEERINPLAYTRDGDRIVIIASYAGAPEHPAWYHNLLTHPVTTIALGAEKLKVRDRSHGRRARSTLRGARHGFPDFQ